MNANTITAPSHLNATCKECGGAMAIGPGDRFLHVAATGLQINHLPKRATKVEPKPSPKAATAVKATRPAQTSKAAAPKPPAPAAKAKTSKAAAATKPPATAAKATVTPPKGPGGRFVKAAPAVRPIAPVVELPVAKPPVEVTPPKRGRGRPAKVVNPTIVEGAVVADTVNPKERFGIVVGRQAKTVDVLWTNGEQSSTFDASKLTLAEDNVGEIAHILALTIVEWRVALGDVTAAALGALNGRNA